MTTGEILLYTGAVMVALSLTGGIPVVVLLRRLNRRVHRQIYTEFN